MEMRNDQVDLEEYEQRGEADQDIADQDGRGTGTAFVRLDGGRS
jgi:hypothetical protein